MRAEIPNNASPTPEADGQPPRPNAMFIVSDSSYRSFFRRNPHCMWFFDMETLAFLDVNDATVEHYGYSLEEFLRMTIEDIRPPEEIPRLRANLARESVGIDHAGVWRHRHKDGRLFYMELTTQRMLFGDREVEMVLAIDATARIEAERKILEQIRELQRWQTVTLGREARIHALKLEVNALLREAGRPLRYLETENTLDEALKSQRLD